MKKFTLVFGYLAAILAVLFVIFKLNAIPGANIALLIAGILFICGYTPLLYVMRNKIAESKAKKSFNLLIMVTMIIGTVTVIFHNYHIQYACTLCWIFFILLIIDIIIEIYLACTTDNEGSSLCKHNSGIMTTIILAFFVFICMSTLPKFVMNEFNCVFDTQNQEIGFFKAKADGFFENFDKNVSGNPAATAFYEKAVQVNNSSDSLIAFIKALGEEMMLAADKKAVAFDSLQMLCHKEDIKSVEEILINQKKDSILNAKLNEYVSFMKENTNSRGREILEMLSPTIIEDSVASQPVDTTATKAEDSKACKEKCSTDACKGCCCCPCSLISTLISFNADILHIRMLQAETMNYLQAMQARAITRSVEPKEGVKE